MVRPPHPPRDRPHYAREHNWHLTVDELSLIPRGWEGDGMLTVFYRRRDIVTYAHLTVNSTPIRMRQA